MQHEQASHQPEADAKGSAKENARQTKAAKTIAVRVLCHCAYGAPDDMASLPATELQAAKEAGIVDDHPEAVAFAKTLPQNQ
jgi:hypothetical protein